MYRLFIFASVLVFFCGTSHAEYLSAVQSIPKSVCMQLNLSREQIADPKLSVPVRDIPSSSGHVLAEAATTLIVPAAQRPTEGFLQVLLSDGRHGWVQAAALKPWRSPTNPDRRCIPSVISNGLIGFDVK